MGPLSCLAMLSRHVVSWCRALMHARLCSSSSLCSLFAQSEDTLNPRLTYFQCCVRTLCGSDGDRSTIDASRSTGNVRRAHQGAVRLRRPRNCSCSIGQPGSAFSSERWLKKAAEWNPELSSRCRTNRAIGRPRKRWENDINEFLEQELEENENPIESSNQTNKTWINIAKDRRRWALLEETDTMTV